MTTILVWWYCSLSSCIMHQATYADLQICAQHLMINSVCIETGKAS